MNKENEKIANDLKCTYVANNLRVVLFVTAFSIIDQEN